MAVGLAVAHASQDAEGKIRKVLVRLDRNIYKDAVSVGIPGTHSSGVDLAVALAIIKGHPQAGLELFKNIEPGDIEQARIFLQDHEVRFELDEEAKGIRITATIVTEKGVYEALIEGAHDRLLEKKVNGLSTFRAETACDESTVSGRDDLIQLHDCSISEIVDTIKTVEPTAILFLLQGVEKNLNAAQAGLAEGAGLELGRALKSLVDGQLIPDSIINRVRILTASAADARMGGIKVPVFGCFGSGNHGITYFITVGEMGRHLGKCDEEIARALALGLIIVGVIKTRTGILTPHCGCAVAAGTGAAAAVTYMLGGTAEQIESAVQLMTANLTGMLCDGAKYGCALKIATSAGVAIETAYLAHSGMNIPNGNGIIGDSFLKTMENLEIVTDRGMKNVDQAVLDVLLGGQK